MDTLERTLMAFRCTDCEALPRVPGAGTIESFEGRDVQIMHNGLRVLAGGYHGDWMAHLIRGLRGHHEPQEERLFAEIVRLARHRSLIVEAGAFWAYYSLWFLSAVPYSRALCVEPDRSNLEVGRGNADLNGLADRVDFVAGAVGAARGEAAIRGETTGMETLLPVYDFGALVELAGGQYIEVLHVDTQGAELPLLTSLPANAGERLRFVVVSTHHSSISGSRTTHRDCLKVLRAKGASILAEHSVQESFSGDGLIVASFLPADKAVALPTISRNTAARSLFPHP